MILHKILSAGLAIFVNFLLSSVVGQEIKILHEGEKVSLRGLSAVSERIVWASGSNGSVVKSLDGGRTWNWMKVAGYESRDFRDIEAFSAKTAIIIAVAEPAVILKTTDGGESWKRCMKTLLPGCFLMP